MSCNHKRVWEMRFYKLQEDSYIYQGHRSLSLRLSDEGSRLLQNGWEPHPWGEGCIMFKRLKPCEDCPKEAEVKQKLKDLGILR